MLLTHLELHNFRCFDQFSLELGHPWVLIEGDNGSGKTSLLEALHYLCYLRSFRTYTPRDLMRFGHDSFFIKAHFTQSVLDVSSTAVQVGFTGKRRLVKIDQQVISSYKELMDHYRIVTVTENDMELINGGPDERRAFLDQASVLHDPDFLPILKHFRKMLENRQALLGRGIIDRDSYDAWTEQLWATSVTIQERRQLLLKKLQEHTNLLLKEHFNETVSISLRYEPKKMKPGESYEDFTHANIDLFEQEVRFRRSLFGAHLDDMAIHFQDKRSKGFASRGQQKLIVMLLKIAHLQELIARRGPAVFLLDDFMTDFDTARIEKLLSILATLSCQRIFTVPVRSGFLIDALMARGAHRVDLFCKNTN
jgi:DNA replication and repair protein RecF